MSEIWGEQIPPDDEYSEAVRSLTIEDWADAILSVNGHAFQGTNTVESIVQHWQAVGARWYNYETKEKVYLQKCWKDGVDTYFLQTYEMNEEDDTPPLKRLRSYPGYTGADICDADWGKMQTGLQPSQEECIFKKYLESSGIIPKNFVPRVEIEAKFWELACIYAVTHPQTQPAIAQWLNTPAIEATDELREGTKAVIRNYERSLGNAMLDHALELAGVIHAADEAISRSRP